MVPSIARRVGLVISLLFGYGYVSVTPPALDEPVVTLIGSEVHVQWSATMRTGGSGFLGHVSYHSL